MNGFLFDSNVLLDVITANAVSREWSREQLSKATISGLAFINPLIYAELTPAFGTRADLDEWLDAADFKRLTLPFEAGWRAGTAFVQYRRAGDPRMSLLPDFYIGAHAETAGLTLVTRDVGRYTTYFPAVKLVTP